MVKERIKIAFTVTFTIDLDRDQEVEVIMQTNKINDRYTIDFIKEFESSELDYDVVVKHAQNQCISYMHSVGLFPILEGLEYLINLDNVSTRSLH